MVAVMVGVAAARLEPAGGVPRAVGLVVGFALVPVAILMLRQVRRGAWENVDASSARERLAIRWL